MKTVVLATSNKGKIAEFKELLKDFELEVKGLDEYPEIGEIPEPGETFLENAIIKAQTVANITGFIAVADDSGLEVDALDGRPGVYSARYSGEDATPAKNNSKLLDELKGVEEAKRTARFVCVMVAATPDNIRIQSRGDWDGRIAFELSGDEGFGYDPLFFDPELGCVAAKMTRETKNSRSHRGKALRALMAQWPEFQKKVHG
ncbi:XTP/dITP diphosphohydrolase [Maridesulfovibrio ferrireducens]|uniref:dITP/XTP pyrophosphatase n=1 Tax=Maridesulfovibrio ferrireducens TaxID=246191 RepID=A0A1G9CVH9_9BACT|nr:XTP/dITP diphosphatase [Maridesulfovibrio ferrireducens]SDK55649.1 XTP/dITP diphosphohydrolase [Maridesulfovibrio ferrireducens]